MINAEVILCAQELTFFFELEYSQSYFKFNQATGSEQVTEDLNLLLWMDGFNIRSIKNHGTHQSGRA